MDLVGGVDHRAVHHNGDGGFARRLRDLLPIGVPAQMFGLGILAAEVGLEGIGAAHSPLALAGDVDGRSAKHRRDIQILLEIGIGAGLAGEAVAPLDEDIAVRRDSRHRDGLAGVGDSIGHRVVAGIAAHAQGAAAVLVHMVVGLELLALAGAGALTAARAFGAAGAFAQAPAGACSLRTGRGHCGAGVGDILHRAGGDVVGVRAAVIGLTGVGADIIQHSFETDALEMDVAVGIIVRDAVAVAAFESLGRVKETDSQLLAHIQKSHIEVVDLGLVHVGIVGVIDRDRRHGVHDDVGIGVALLDGLNQRRIVGDEVRDFHAGVVGAEGHDHPAGLHHGHSLRDGVVVRIFLKGNDALVERRLRTDALLRAELLQRDEAVVVEADGIGVAQEEGVVQVIRTGVGGLRQQGGRGVVDLVMARQVFARSGVCRRLRDRGRGGVAAFFQERGRDAEGQQHGQNTENADQNGPLLHESQIFFFRLHFSTHKHDSSRSGMGKLVHRAEDPFRQLLAVCGHKDRCKGRDLLPAAVTVQHRGGVQPAVPCALHIVAAVADHQNPLALHDRLVEDMTDDVRLVVTALVH